MNQHNDTTGMQGGDPEERAFTGHPDHPPAQPDHEAEDNQELLRTGEGEGENDGGSEERSLDDTGEGEHRSPGEATTLPGYGG